MEVPEESKDPNPVLPEAAAPAGDKPAAAETSEAVTAKPVPPASEKAASPQAAAPATPAAAKPAVAAGEKPATPPAAAKPAAPLVKPAVKPDGPKPEPWDSPLVSSLKSQYGSGIREAVTYLGQKYLVVDSSILYEILLRMRENELFDYCVDVTAVHYPKREAQFDIIYILYSFHNNERVRVKAQIKDGESVRSVASIWPPPTGWSAKSSTCSASALMAIPN